MMADENSRRRPSSSVIAKLMGLDDLPPPMAVDRKNKSTGNSHSILSVGFEKKQPYNADFSCQIYNNESIEPKDVFEIMETSKTEKKNLLTQSRMSSLKYTKSNPGFIEQKSLDLKHPSTKETHQKSRELSNVLGIARYNKVHFNRCFEEPHCSSVKLHKDPQYFTTSCRRSYTTNSELLPDICGSGDMEEEVQWRNNLQKDWVVPRNSSTDFSRQFLNGGSYLYDFRRSRNTDKDIFSHPTQNFILKSNTVEKQKVARGYTRNSQVSYRGREFWKTIDQYADGKSWQRPSAYVLGHGIKTSRGIVGDLTKQKKNAISGCTGKETYLRYNRYGNTESLCGICNPHNQRGIKYNHNFLGDRNASNYFPFSSYSSNFSTIKAAQGQISERWKVTNNFEKFEPVVRGSSTGKMHDLSKRKASQRTFQPWLSQDVSDGKAVASQSREGDPLDVNSRCDSRSDCILRIPRSASHASSLDFGSARSSSRHSESDAFDNMLKDVINLQSDHLLGEKFNQKRESSGTGVKDYKAQVLRFTGEENDIPIREIHTSSEGWRTGAFVSNFAEDKTALTEFAGSVASEQKNASIPPFCSLEHIEKPIDVFTTMKYEKSFVTHVINETSYDKSQSDSFSSLSDENELDFLVSNKVAEQPSPDSVLEPEGEFNSHNFEGVGADLYELRRYLELVMIESEEGCTKGTEKDAEEKSLTSVKMMEALFSSFRDEEDRDFSFMLDMLIESGAGFTYNDRLFDACYSFEYPIIPNIFNKLEIKYGALVTWSRQDRKLLFDLINISLAKIMAPSFHIHPWLRTQRDLTPKCTGEGIVEELWQMLVRQRKEMSFGCLESNALDQNWLELAENISLIGSDIEGMLIEDIVDEIVSDFILG